MSEVEKHSNDRFQLERISLFSDGVFAIAITLLIIEIKVPVLPDENPAFSMEFPHAINGLLPEFIGFLISFAVIGSYWRSHHTMFGFLVTYDRKLLKLNTLFLITIVIMPFTTAFMSRYMLFQPFFLYCGNVILSGLFQLRLWSHITNPSNNLYHQLPIGVKQYKAAVTIVSIACFVLALLIHKLPFWTGNWPGLIARIFLVSIFWINSFTEKYYRKKYQLGKKY